MTALERKAKELRQHVEAANICVRELIEMGARPEIDTVPISSMQHPDAFVLVPRVMIKVRDE